MSLPSMGSTPRYVEELRIGGGYGTTDGGVDFDKQGNIAADGDLRVDGGVNAGGSVMSWKVFLGARNGWPTLSLGCSQPVQVDLGNAFYPSIYVMDFDKDADEYSKFNLFMPTDYDGRALQVTVHWTATEGSSGHVRWVVNARCFGDHDSMDTNVSQNIVLDDVFNAQNEVHVITGTITPTDAANGGLLALMVRRQADHAEDTFNADARLIGISLRYS